MISLPLGLVGFAAILYISIKEGAWGLYFNPQAIIIVVGGTFMILLLSTPFSILKILWMSFVRFFKKAPTLETYMDILIQLARDKKSASAIRGANHPLIDYAVDLWKKGVTPELFAILLTQRWDQIENENIEAVHTLKNLSKYPPAMGMMGTVMGLIGLFSNLNGDKKGLIGPELAIALTATFYGLILANGVVAPLSDRLNVEFLMNKKFNKSLFEIIILINSGDPAVLIESEVRSRDAA